MSGRARVQNREPQMAKSDLATVLEVEDRGAAVIGSTVLQDVEHRPESRGVR
jgi:hypothetical protein